MNKIKREEIFARLKTDNPKPETELNFSNHYDLLVAVVLSAQATDVSVNKATNGLFKVANNPQAMLDLGIDRLKTHIKTIGLFNSKAKHIMQAAQLLVSHHEGAVPSTREALEALPGVGRKTANVVLNTAFRQIAMAVDTHIFRWANRTRVAPGKDVVAVEKQLLKFVPKEYLLDAHHWMILHGRYICVARKPHCGACTIEDLCEFKQKTSD